MTASDVRSYAQVNRCSYSEAIKALAKPAKPGTAVSRYFAYNANLITCTVRKKR